MLWWLTWKWLWFSLSVSQIRWWSWMVKWWWIRKHMKLSYFEFCKLIRKGEIFKRHLVCVMVLLEGCYVFFIIERRVWYCMNDGRIKKIEKKCCGWCLGLEKIYGKNVSYLFTEWNNKAFPFLSLFKIWGRENMKFRASFLSLVGGWLHLFHEPMKQYIVG